MHCDTMQEMRGAVVFTSEEYSKEAVAVGLGRARPPRCGVLEEQKGPFQYH